MTNDQNAEGPESAAPAEESPPTAAPAANGGNWTSPSGDQAPAPRFPGSAPGAAAQQPGTEPSSGPADGAPTIPSPAAGQASPGVPSYASFPPPPPGSVPSGPAPADYRTATAPRPGGGTAIAALVLGIVSLLFAILPFIAFGAYLTAIVGVILGIVALVKRSPRTAMAITGLALSAVSFLVATLMVFVTIGIVAGISGEIDKSGGIESFLDEIEESAGPTLLPEAVTESGTGNGTIDAVPVDGPGNYGIAEIIVRGEGHVLITGLDAAGSEVEQILDVDLPYNGQLLYNLYDEVASFDIVTSGQWDVRLESTLIVPELRTDSSYAGDGDKVLWYAGPAAGASLEMGQGTGGYLWSTGSAEPSLCEVGGSEVCEFDVTEGGIFLQIYSYDSWTVGVGEGAVIGTDET